MAEPIDEDAAMPEYQIYQILTVIVGLAGAALTAWAMVRALKSGSAETSFGTLRRDRSPRAFHTLTALYGLAVVVLLSAAASGAALLFTGRY